MSNSLQTWETCSQFHSEARHSVPKISWGSFRGQREKKSGDHFGVNLRISSGSGIISEPVQLLVIFNVRDFDFGRRVLDGFPDLSRSYEGFFNSTADHCDSEFRLGFTPVLRSSPDAILAFTTVTLQNFWIWWVFFLLICCFSLKVVG